MKNYGDITKIDGATLPSVDIITGGSPCQNFSSMNHTNGKGGGLDGADSKLFFEFIRVITEMRDKTPGKPRYVVFENVPQVLFSNNGRDFITVLTELIRIHDPDFVFETNLSGKWPPAGYLRGETAKWSVAWRVCDSSKWGVGQKRRRLMVLVDYDGHTASSILHRCAGSGATDKTLLVVLDGLFGNQWTSVLLEDGNTGEGPNVPVTTHLKDIVEDVVDSKYHLTKRQAHIILDNAKHYGLNLPMALTTMLMAVGMDDDQIVVLKNDWFNGLPMTHQLDFRTKKREMFCMWRSLQTREWNFTPYANTIRCEIGMDGTKNPLVVTLKVVKEDSENITYQFAIRRFTPVEIERLFGYPDNWTETANGVDGIADTHRYRFLGNTIALPQWQFLMNGLTRYADPGLTVGSLFDGIGGFPLCAGNAGIETLWVSEIDELASAVVEFNSHRPSM